MKTSQIVIFLPLFLLTFILKGSTCWGLQLKRDTLPDSSRFKLSITERKTLQPLGSLQIGDTFHFWLSGHRRPQRGIIKGFKPDSLFVNSGWIGLNQIKALNPYSDYKKRRSNKILSNIGISLLLGIGMFLGGITVFALIRIIYSFGGHYPFESKEVPYSLIAGFLFSLVFSILYSKARQSLKLKQVDYLFEILPQSKKN